jgi:hypothetical protein
MQALRKEIEAQIRAEMEKATDPANDMGNSDQGPLKVATSADVAQAAQGGSGTSLAARLVNLSKSAT